MLILFFERVLSFICATGFSLLEVRRGGSRGKHGPGHIVGFGLTFWRRYSNAVLFSYIYCGRDGVCRMYWLSPVLDSHAHCGHTIGRTMAHERCAASVPKRVRCMSNFARKPWIRVLAAIQVCGGVCICNVGVVCVRFVWLVCVCGVVCVVCVCGVC